MIVREWNAGQREAIERRGRVFVSAGAGTGKTAVLVERAVRRVEAGTPVDHLLIITFTERAADELKRRIRERLHDMGLTEAAASVQSAWVSTIHGFCSRLLRGHALEAGIDPSFGVAADTEMRILQSEAFGEALERYAAGDAPGRLDVLARYGSDRLRRMTVELHTRLRGLGLPLDLVAYRPPDLPRAIDEARVAALAAGDDPNAQALLAVLGRDLDPAELVDLSEHGVDAKAPVKEAVEAVQEAAQDVAADADRVLLEELLREFDASYSEIKNGRGLLDFNDLELEARALLQSRPEVAQECRERFVEVMVDEFQDTNALQVELVELVRGGDLFLVGDEFQSIYRFRRADVNVYRERRAQAGDELVALTENYRSAPHILDLVNETFTRESGSAYTDLVAANGAEPDPGLPSVELLLTDIRACKEEELIWRTAEAESIAERVAELVGQGHCGYGDVVLLFEAGTDAGIYEGELRKLGIPTVRATGRGYYGQQEVGDILQYLRLLLNRTDDRALLSVLASPLVGLSPDGLALLRLATRRAAAIGAFEPGRWPQDYSESDNRLAQAFRLRFERLVDQHSSLSLEQLCERVVAEHDFDLALLARPDGDRRLANVRKLIRLAREYEQLRGPDLDGFVRFCEEQADLASREGDAAIADEGGDAVMLMTVHAAKGLEFEVVVIADAGRRPGGRWSDVVVDSRGRVGFRAAPDTGINRPALGMKALQDAEAQADAEEGRRKQYVAMTRARRHLIISGGIAQPTDNTPIAALCQTLGIGLHSEGVVDLGRTSVVVKIVRPSGEPAPEVSEYDQLHLFGESPETLPDLPPFEPVARPPAHAVRRMSYSGLALYDRCGYRFYAQRLLRLPERERVREPAQGMAGVEVGDAVHLLLEHEDERWRELYPHATAEDEQRIERMVTGWRGSDLAGRLAGLAGVTLEQPFAFELDGVLFRGRFDAFHRDGGGSALVVDYKTNLLGEKDPEDIVERSYRHQVAIYALAVLAAGAQDVEVAYAFLDRPGSVVTRSYTSADADTLRGGLRESLSPIQAGRFEARPGPYCAECPALDLLCAGPALPTE